MENSVLEIVNGLLALKKIHDVTHSLFPNALVFTCLQYQSFENNVRKGEIARKEQFLLFPHCFLPICITFCHLH